MGKGNLSLGEETQSYRHKKCKNHKFRNVVHFVFFSANESAVMLRSIAKNDNAFTPHNLPCQIPVLPVSTPTPLPQARLAQW
jgi:hypothetical protein